VDSVKEGQRTVIVDDLLATGGKVLHKLSNIVNLNPDNISIM